MKKRTLACFGLLGLWIVIGLAEQVVPVAVSPGRAKGVAVVSELRPTFSWTSVDWAVSYRIAVFEALGVAPVSYEQMASGGSTPVLTKEIEGRGLSWTPSTEEGLPGGGMYVWYVEAIGPSGPGVWSLGRVFIVSGEAGGVSTEERVTKVLRENGIREEVISNVVKDMKTGEAGAIAGGEVVSGLQGDVRAMGTEGTSNTFYGLEAGNSTTGLGNTFIGRKAGFTNGTGTENSFLGYETGYSTTTGQYNSFMGVFAGRQNTTGHSNVYLGYSSGRFNVSGTYNTFVGYNAGGSGASGNDNSFFGYCAGTVNTANSNTFLGFMAGYANTSGGSNTFGGNRAGYNNTTGYSNSFFGNKAGFSNTTGFGNMFAGDEAGFYNTTGEANTFLGNSSGHANTTGKYNTFLGFQSGISNTTGNGNTFAGRNTGFSNTTGNNNTFSGCHAGATNTTGVNNTFIGYETGYDNADGSDNTFLGYCAGNKNTHGSFNTFIGISAGYNNTSGLYNTHLGYGAGYTGLGHANVFLGYLAGFNESGSNKLYIANSNTSSPLIYGDFSSKVLGVNGLLGVGTQTPTYPMELKTSGRNATFVLQRDDGGAINFVNATPLYGQFGTGNNYPVRILVNQAWKMQLNADGSLQLANGAGCTAGGHWYDGGISSRELKENIEELGVAESQAALEQLVPVKYSYKVEKGERHVGFIAEDVPELVATKDRKSVGAMDVVSVLTKVVKEQQKIIADQEKTLSEQQKAISELKERVAKIENKGNMEKQY